MLPAAVLPKSRFPAPFLRCFPALVRRMRHFSCRSYPFWTVIHLSRYCVHEITNCNHHSGLSLTKQCFCDTISVTDITKLYNYHKQRQGIEMENQFIRHEPCFERILFVLTLDRKKMKERILIGEEQQIRFRLNGSQNAEVLCDMTRPLGTFLINFERDTDRDWNLYGLSPLRQASTPTDGNSRSWSRRQANFSGENILATTL